MEDGLMPTSDYISFAAARSAQADALDEAIARLSASVLEQQAANVFTGPGPIFVGIGASLAAASSAVWTLRSRGIHSWRLGAGEHPIPFPSSQHPVIGISQSGKSTETLDVLESIQPSLRYAVVNAVPSPVARAAGRFLALGNIPDSYASTIGYTATVVALGMIADAWDGHPLDEGWSTLTRHFRSVEASMGARAAELASLFDSVTSADFVGGPESTGSAEASSLLFREVARIHSAGMGTRQYLHGSMESAGDGVHVLFGQGRELEVARTLSTAGHKVVLVTSADIAEVPNLRVVRLPVIPPAQRAILEILVAQILVAEVATRRGVAIEEFVFENADTKVSEQGS
jgi:fructoselysine-6-P-deglycase FrlB-like protein